MHFTTTSVLSTILPLLALAQQNNEATVMSLASEELSVLSAISTIGVSSAYALATSIAAPISGNDAIAISQVLGLASSEISLSSTIAASDVSYAASILSSIASSGDGFGPAPTGGPLSNSTGIGSNSTGAGGAGGNGSNGSAGSGSSGSSGSGTTINAGNTVSVGPNASGTTINSGTTVSGSGNAAAGPPRAAILLNAWVSAVFVTLAAGVGAMAIAL